MAASRLLERMCSIWSLECVVKQEQAAHVNRMRSSQNMGANVLSCRNDTKKTFFTGKSRAKINCPAPLDYLNYLKHYFVIVVVGQEYWSSLISSDERHSCPLVGHTELVALSVF